MHKFTITELATIRLTKRRQTQRTHIKSIYRRMFLLSLAILVSQLPVQTASASGSGGLPPSGGLQSPMRPIDEIYEVGKQIYQGRAEGTEKIKYCVFVAGDLKKLRRRSSKQFKGVSRKDFALALRDCNNSERLALTTMERGHVPLVLYYLEKRFKLTLEDDA